MVESRKEVIFYFDALLASSDVFNMADMMIEIVIENDLQVKTLNIDIQQDNVVQTLDIQENIFINGNIGEYPTKIAIYEKEIEIIKEELFIHSSMIGALKSTGEFQFTLIFRIINNYFNDIEVYNVPKFYLDDFKLVKELEGGLNGKTYVVIDSSNVIHVLKMMKNKINIKNKDDPTIREIVPFITLPEHPCVIKLDGFIYDQKHGIVLVLEYASRGRIDSIDFEKLDKGIGEQMLYRLFSCIAFFHDHGFIHRDIHPSNVLVNEKYEIKIIDFGVSRFYDQEMTSNVGHPGYKSPEMEKPRYYDELVDEYMVGVLLSKIYQECCTANFLANLLMIDDRNYRITCSEICTMIECECICSNSEEDISFFNKLSKYHESKPLRNCIIIMLARFSINFNFVDTYCNLIKLLVNLGEAGAQEWLDFIIIYHTVIALDLEYFMYEILLNEFDFEPDSPIANQKLNYLYDYFHSIESGESQKIDSIFFKKFNEYYWEMDFLFNLKNVDEFIYTCIHLAVNCFSDKKFLWYLDRLYEKANKYNENLLRLIFHLLSNNSSTEIYMKSVKYAAKLKDPKTCELVAITYLKNNNYIKAKKYLKIGMKGGKYLCGYILGSIYHEESKFFKEIQYLKNSSEHREPFSMFRLGKYYIKGINVDQNIQRGLDLLKTSADKGNYLAQHYLAKMNFYGRYIPKNYEQAFWYNLLSLRQNCLKGLWMRGLFYFYGIVVKQDFVEAQLIFEQCNMEKNHVYPHLLLINYFGLGIETNPDRTDYYKQISEHELSKQKYKIIDLRKRSQLIYEEIKNQFLEDIRKIDLEGL